MSKMSEFQVSKYVDIFGVKNSGLNEVNENLT
jgi:hypothetical protein